MRSQTQAARLLPFQGRLADASRKPIPDGVRVVQFQIYGEPSGGNVLWAGEVHRVTINGGLVNVILGSKNPLPRDRADQPDKSFFDQPLYLQITVDANDDGKISDDKLDPPMLPRQSILPVVFALESGNARKLQGFDWSALFGVNNPVDGKIPATKLVDAGVTAAQIAFATITSNQIANQTISAAQIARNSISSDRFAPRPVGASVPIGGIARSSSSEIFNTSELSYVDVPNLVLTIVTTGRPVFVGLIPDENTNDAPNDVYFPGNSGFVGAWGPTINSAYGGNFLLVREGAEIAKWSIAAVKYVYSPASTVHTIDFPPARTNTYQLRARSVHGTVIVNRSRLVAYEL